MSKVSTIYDALQTLVESNLTTYTKIPDPYKLEDNTELFLVKGFGIGMGNGENTERLVCGYISIRRSFTIALVNKVTTTENNLSSIATSEKNIMEDCYTLIKALEADTDLQGNCVKSTYLSDSGIEFIDSDLGKYLLLQMEVDIEYLDAV